MSHVKEIREALESDADVVLVRAPPGSGKTRAAVRFAIAKAIAGKRTAIFFRTRTEVEHGLRLFVTENYAGVIPIVGKDALCRLGEKVRWGRWWCFYKECPFFAIRDDAVVEEAIRRAPRTLEELKNYLSSKLICPFHALMRVVRRAPVVLATHPFLLYDDVFERLGKRDYVIVDEAHSLIFVRPKRIHVSLARRYERVLRDVDITDPRSVASLLRTAAEPEKLAEYLEWLLYPGIEMRVRSWLFKVLIPHMLIRRRLQRCEKIIIMSSTLWPIGFFERVFGRGLRVERFVIKGMSGTEKRKIYAVLCGLTTSYHERSRDMIKQYANAVRAFAKVVRPLLVFTPSKQIGEALCRELGMVFERPKDGVLVTVARGKFAEGVDVKIDGKEPRVALMIGLPYPRPDEDLVLLCRAYARYYGMSERETFNLMMEASMVTALIQASGRVGRTKPGIFFVLDDRAERLGLPTVTLRQALSLARGLK